LLLLAHGCGAAGGGGQTLYRSTGSEMLGGVPTDSPHGASGNGSGAGVGG
jgi:hypothetical protein